MQLPAVALLLACSRSLAAVFSVVAGELGAPCLKEEIERRNSTYRGRCNDAAHSVTKSTHGALSSFVFNFDSEFLSGFLESPYGCL